MCNYCLDVNELKPVIQADFLVSCDGQGSRMARTMLVLGQLSGFNTGVWGLNPGQGSMVTLAVAIGNSFRILKYTHSVHDILLFL